MSSYYDLDAILSEEELVPCWTNFDFSHLTHLDPDYHVDDAKTTNVLAEGRKLKMPIWAMQKWGPMGYVKMVLPRHYGRKAREKLEADPLQVDLSKRNEQFFGTGVALMDLWETCRRQLSTQQVPRKHRRKWQQEMDQLQQEARELRTSLVSAYTGDRLQRTMDWSWSAVADDVSALTDRLTVWELRLFFAGSRAVQDWEMWQQQGKRRTVLRRVVTPATTHEATAGGRRSEDETSPSKRARLE